MGSLKELGDLLKDAKGTIKEIKTGANEIKGNSIAKQSSAATLQFPIIMSRSINVDTASSVVKALERQYAIFVQMVISLNPVMNWDEYKSIPEFINRIHQNNPTPIDVIESCINVYSDEAYELLMFTSINEGCNGAVLRSNKEQMFSIEDHLNQNKLNDLYRPEQITLERADASLDYYLLTEAKKRPKRDSGKNFNKSNANDPDVNDSTVINGKATASTDSKKDNKNIPKQAESKDDVKMNGHNNNKYAHEEDKQYTYQTDQQKEEMAKAQLKKDIEKADIENRAKTMVKLSDNDVKKCNELVPTTLTVSVQQIKGDNFGTMLNFVLGVKGLMHPVNSAEMVSNLLDGYKAGNKFFNFLRWTSGEISFLKDLILNVDGIKDDVIKKHNKGSHWWTTLKRNRTLARIKNTYGKNRILPNATIACSMEEVLEIKDTYNVDLMDPRNVAKLMDRYFLIGFVIVDESQELCYFMFDGENEFQALSFKGLERDNNNKNDFKDIYKMINSGRL